MAKVIKPYVDDTYFDLVPRPKKTQRDALKESIKLEGQKEPIVVDETGRIIDGHTRFEICQELSLKPKFVVKEFKSEDEKKRHAVIVNLKRRHLNDYQIFELTFDEFQKIKEEKESERGKNIWATRKGEKPRQSYQEKSRNATLTELSEKTGVGVHSLEICRYIKYNGDKKLQTQILEGTVGVHEAYHKLKNKLKPMSTLKGSTYRSRMGIVFDIMRAITNTQGNVKISHICRMANLSHYATQDYLKPLIKHGMIDKISEKTKTKYYENDSKLVYYQLTNKGMTYFKKCTELYDMLPMELNDLNGVKI